MDFPPLSFSSLCTKSYHRWQEGLPDREKVSKHLAASKWINQVLVIKKISNENVSLEEKCWIFSGKHSN